VTITHKQMRIVLAALKRRGAGDRRLRRRQQRRRPRHQDGRPERSGPGRPTVSSARFGSRVSRDVPLPNDVAKPPQNTATFKYFEESTRPWIRIIAILSRESTGTDVWICCFLIVNLSWHPHLENWAWGLQSKLCCMCVVHGGDPLQMWDDPLRELW